MPHGVLLEGPQGLGKRYFADWLTALVLCDATSSKAKPCGECRACRWLVAGTHPDFHEVQPEEDKKWISVEQVRELVDKLMLKSFSRAGRVALITPASNLTESAANSLLKTLEEPGAGSVLILITSRAARLPATVRSRCQRLRFPIPAFEQAQAWLAGQDANTDWTRLLELAGGAPLAALARHEAGFAALDRSFREDLEALILRRRDPFDVAGRWSRCAPDACLDWLYDCTRRLIVSRFAGDERRADAGLQKAAKHLKLERLFHYLDRVHAARAAIDSALSWPLQVESLLIPWSDELRSPEEDPIIG